MKKIKKTLSLFFILLIAFVISLVLGFVGCQALIRETDPSVHKTYYHNGSLQSVCKYDQGKKQGTETEYFMFDMHKLSNRQKILKKFIARDYHGPIKSVAHYVHGNRVGAYYEYTANGKVRLHAQYLDGVRSGAYQEYSWNGTVLLCSANFVRGKLQGAYTQYYANGAVHVSENYTAGFRDGASVRYSPAGDITETAFYVYGRLHGEHAVYTQGVLSKLTVYAHGVKLSEKEFAPNGALIKVSPFVRGQIHGTRLQYYPTGVRKATEPFVAGFKQGFSLYYNENGVLHEQIFYVDGLKNGIATTFYENGAIQAEAYYEKGLLEGEYKRYFKKRNEFNFFQLIWNVLFGWLSVEDNRGPISCRMSYVHNVLHGPTIIYYESGMLHWLHPYVSGKLQGEMKVYYENGTLMGVIPFVQGKEHGVAKIFFADGGLMQERTYVNGAVKQVKNYKPKR